MRVFILACALLPLAASAAAAAAEPLSAIPYRYHGRWAADKAACADTSHFTKAVEINASGWRSFEEGGDVVRVLSSARGSHRYGVDAFAGGERYPGTITLKLRGDHRLTMTHANRGEKKTEALIRCR